LVQTSILGFFGPPKKSTSVQTAVALRLSTAVAKKSHHPGKGKKLLRINSSVWTIAQELITGFNLERKNMTVDSLLSAIVTRLGADVATSKMTPPSRAALAKRLKKARDLGEGTPLSLASAHLDRNHKTLTPEQENEMLGWWELCANGQDWDKTRLLDFFNDIAHQMGWHDEDEPPFTHR